MVKMPDLKVSEAQVIELARQLSPSGKRKILQALIALDMTRLDRLVDYGESRIRELCAERGIEWDDLGETEREALIDNLLHET
jgi:hypothetical protein